MADIKEEKTTIIPIAKYNEEEMAIVLDYVNKSIDEYNDKKEYEFRKNTI